MQDIVDSKIAPSKFRALVKAGQWDKPTAGICTDYVQVNLAIMPGQYAEDFQRFCEENPKPCPLLEVVKDGGFEASAMAPGSDIRKDFPGYVVLQESSVVANCSDISAYWQPDFASFLIGCSFTFEQALLDSDIPVRHIELGVNVPMFITNIPCKKAGPFSGNMVVSMRPIPRELVDKAYEITSHFPAVHGAPFTMEILSK